MRYIYIPEPIAIRNPLNGEPAMKKQKDGADVQWTLPWGEYVRTLLQHPDCQKIDITLRFPIFALADAKEGSTTKLVDESWDVLCQLAKFPAIEPGFAVQMQSFTFAILNAQVGETAAHAGVALPTKTTAEKKKR